MVVHTGELRFSTEGEGNVIDLGDGVRSVLRSSGVEDGVASLFVPDPTAAITVVAVAPGGAPELGGALERLPGDSRVRAALVGPSQTVPVREGRLALAAEQRLVLLDFDDRPRRHTVVVQVIG